VCYGSIDTASQLKTELCSLGFGLPFPGIYLLLCSLCFGLPFPELYFVLCSLSPEAFWFKAFSSSSFQQCLLFVFNMAASSSHCIKRVRPSDVCDYCKAEGDCHLLCRYEKVTYCNRLCYKRAWREHKHDHVDVVTVLLTETYALPEKLAMRIVDEAWAMHCCMKEAHRRYAKHCRKLARHVLQLTLKRGFVDDDIFASFICVMPRL